MVCYITVSHISVLILIQISSHLFLQIIVKISQYLLRILEENKFNDIFSLISVLILVTKLMFFIRRAEHLIISDRNYYICRDFEVNAIRQSIIILLQVFRFKCFFGEF